VLLAQIVAGDSYLPDTKKPQFRSAALKRAIEVLGNYEQLPDNVESLCQMAYCSWDTLRRAFKEEFGLSPKAYMKARRLAAVQAELVRLGPGAGITNVANKRVGSHAI
jgi:methylphosphotriester-DNA--protein-cysteine methyltransferase